MLARIANREDPDQTLSLFVHVSGHVSVLNFRTFTVINC